MTFDSRARYRACDYALAQLGKRYVLGDEGPDTFDCSGLVQAAWAAGKAGRYGADWPACRTTAHGMYEACAPIPEGGWPEPGDAAFYGHDGHASHVVIVTAVDPMGITREVVGASSKLGRVAPFRARHFASGTRPAHLYRRDFLGFRRMPS